PGVCTEGETQSLTAITSLPEDGEGVRQQLFDRKLSAHAVGKAIDISGFDLSSGKFIPIKPDGDEAMRNVVDAARTAACGWFTTVLGPGSDAAHTDHLHVDMALHGTSDRYRICQ